MTPAFTANPMPRPDRFRCGDSWRGADGRLYRVIPNVQGQAGHVTLHPVAGDIRMHLMATRIPKGFRRVSWGGKQ